MDAKQRPAVVIDCGTGYTKMGFAGNVEPSYIIPTAIGVKDGVQQSSHASRKPSPLDDLDFLTGADVFGNPAYNVKYPIQHGQVDNNVLSSINSSTSFYGSASCANTGKDALNNPVIT
eukprot:8461269-Pyramimonas_sp.AAC.1